MRLLINLPLIAVTVFILNACEENTTPLNDGSTPIKEGFIRGTIATTRDNGLPITIGFNHEYRFGPTIMQDYVQFNRSESFEAAWFEFGNSTIAFYLDSLTDPVPDPVLFILNETLELDNDTTFLFGASNDEDTQFNITNYRYDRNASTVSGDFAVQSTNTINGKEAKIEGTFNIKVYHYVYKQLSTTSKELNYEK